MYIICPSGSDKYMKNYATKDEEHSFILYFDTIEDENGQKWIIIHYADGTQEKTIYSTQEKRTILEKMRRQVIKSKKLYEELLNNFSKAIYAMIGLGFINMAAITMLIMSIIQSLSIYVPLCLIVPLTLSIGVLAKDAIKDKKTIDDIEKHMIFIKNMDSLNQVEVKQEHLSKVSPKAKKVIGNNQTIDLNDIHNLSIDDTIELLEEENKPKVYKKKK